MSSKTTKQTKQGGSAPFWTSEPDLRTVLSWAVAACSLGVLTASVLGALGGWFWLFDLASPFRLQFAALLLIASVALLALRSRPAAVVVGMLFLIHILALRPLVVSPTQPAGAGPELRVIQFNVLTSNTEVARAGAWLAEEAADVVVAQETDQRWTDGLEQALPDMQRLPTQTARDDNFGITVFVRKGLQTTDVRVTGGSLPSITFTALIDNTEPVGETTSVLIHATHLLPPMSADNVEVANEQIDIATGLLAADADHRLLIGDLNATRWSAIYRRTLAETGLRDASDGQGFTGTWPSRLIPLTRGITLDHVLISSSVRVADHNVGPDLGSDHRPVTVDLVLTSES